MISPNANTIVVPSTSADTTNFYYTQVIVNGAGPFSVILNGQSLSLAGPNVFNLNVGTVNTGHASVLLGGFRKPSFNNPLGSN